MAEWYWIGSAVEQSTMNRMVRNGYTQQAANNAQWGIIQGIESIIEHPINIINAYLTSAFPSYKKVVIRSKVWNHAEGANDYDVGYVNLFFLNLISKAISLLVHCMRLKGKSKSTTFVYSLHTPYLISAYLLKKCGSRVVCFVPDLPEFMDLQLDRKPLKRMLKILDRYLIHYIIKKFDYFVLFTEPMAARLKITKPWMVMEGMVDDCIRVNANKKVHKKTVMYSGTLEEKYGIGVLLRAFELIEDKDLNLLITGRGSAEKDIVQACKRDSRIKFLGFLENRDRVVELEEEAGLLINLRDPNELSTRYCFPSKVLEYMVTGTPVLSVRIEGIPDEYYRRMLTIDSLSINTLRDAIVDFFSMNEVDRQEMGYKARTFIIENKSGNVQARKILEFIGFGDLSNNDTE